MAIYAIYNMFRVFSKAAQDQRQQAAILLQKDIFIVIDKFYIFFLALVKKW